MYPEMYLLRLSLAGIKNIEKEISIEFYKKTIDKNFDPEQYRVKAIYGENGSGKTGIVLAVKILRALLLDPNYLSDSANQEFLHEVINKKSRELKLECEFYYRMGTVSRVYRYSIALNDNKKGRFEISEESLASRNGNYAASPYEDTFIVKDGSLLHVIGEDWEVRDIQQISMNLLSHRSLASILSTWAENRKNDGDVEKLYSQLSELFVFGALLNPSLEEEDRQKNRIDRSINIDFAFDEKVRKKELTT